MSDRGIRGAIRYMTDARHLVSYTDGLLLWDADGKIVACGEYQDLHAQLPTHVKIQDYRGHLIVPGFVDCHVHLPQLDCRNKTGLTLLKWLEQYIFPAEAQFSDPVVARDTARRFYQELLKNGTTTAMIYCTIHEQATDIAFEEAERAGVRAIIGKVMMDQNSPPVLRERLKDMLPVVERLIVKWHGRYNRLFYAVTPRFALTCSKELLCEAGKLAQATECYFQTHLAERRDEVALAYEMFGMKDYAGLFHDCGCLGNKSVYAHCIYLDDPDWKMLAETQSVVAHCPSSNIFLKSGRMPYEEVTRHGLRCGLGSDVGAGPEFSMWDVMRCGCEVHPANVFSSQDAFYRATLGGAEALDFADQIGSFDVGKDADFVVSKVNEGAASVAVLPTLATYIKGQCLYQNSLTF